MPRPPTTYHGQCHCGAVRFRATTDLSGLADCNCSRCRRLGWVMQAVPQADFVLESGAEALTEYRFNTKEISHLFCTTCGIESFARGADAQGKAMVMINIDCLDNLPKVERAAITHWDGVNW